MRNLALAWRWLKRDLAAGELGIIALALVVAAMSLGILTLVALFVDMAIDGFPRLTSEFFTSFPSRRAGQAGILSAWAEGAPAPGAWR